MVDLEVIGEDCPRAAFPTSAVSMQAAAQLSHTGGGLGLWLQAHGRLSALEFLRVEKRSADLCQALVRIFIERTVA